MANPIRVLVVEDSEPDARLVIRELRNSGFDPVYERVETPEAMRSALDSREWDIIIADFSLPHFSGPDALKLLLDSGKDIPFILVSGTIPRETAIEMMRSGAQDFVLKHDLSRLGPAVARELRASEIRERRRRAEESLREEQEHRFEFYRRLILAATNGKLSIADVDEIARIAGPAVASWEIRNTDDMARVRQDVRELAVGEGMDENRAGRFVLSIGEAVTNAIKHAGGGRASLHRLKDGIMFVITDKGPGIAALSLPDVALRRGYSTAGTLGMGYKVMIRLCDRVYLATGPDGTTVGLEMRFLPSQEVSLAPDITGIIG